MSCSSLLSAILTTCAQAGTDWPPPARFDYRPTKPFVEYVLPQREVAKKCHEVTDGFITNPNVIGCAQIMSDDRTWIVVVSRNGAFGVSEAAIRRHEYGHVNGWKGNHPR